MNVQIKSSNGISLVPIESRLMAERKIFIQGEIDAESACVFVQQLMFLVGEDTEKPIDIFINSPGGEVNSGLLIYDTIKGLKTPINIPIFIVWVWQLLWRLLFWQAGKKDTGTYCLIPRL